MLCNCYFGFDATELEASLSLEVNFEDEDVDVDVVVVTSTRILDCASLANERKRNSTCKERAPYESGSNTNAAAKQRRQRYEEEAAVRKTRGYTQHTHNRITLDQSFGSV